MDILALSDLHGYLPKIEQPFDLMVIAGDVCPVICHGKEFQKDWIENEFLEWIKSLNYKDKESTVVMVWGNHDFVGYSMDELDLAGLYSRSDDRLIILNNEPALLTYDARTIKIFGTPYCTIFGRWCFMVNDDRLNELYSEIPEDLDLLISHDSPTTNKLGAIFEGFWKNETTGNKILAKYIAEKRPQMFLSGHFHSGNHNFEEIDGTYMANVSFVNEAYEPINKCLHIEYDLKERKVVSHDIIEVK